MSYYSYDGLQTDERPDEESEQRAERLDRLGDDLLGGQTDRQKEIAGRIYEQLKAGSDIDDLKPLIADLSRTATDDAKRRDANRPGGGYR